MKLKVLSLSGIILQTFILLLPKIGLAENLYIDNTSPCIQGTLCAGTSWATAWKRFADIGWGTGTNKVGPGDTLFISGGASSKTYQESLSIGASGIAGSPITIRVGQDSDHNGVVILDFTTATGQGNSTSIIAINATGRNYITISGNYNGTNHLKIQNLFNFLNGYNGTGIYAFGESASKRITGILIENIDMNNINNGMRLAYIDKSEIRNCNVTGVRGDVGIEMVGLNSGATWDDTLVHHNNLELLVNSAKPAGASESYNGPDGIQAENGASIYNNKITAKFTTVFTSTQHSDQIQATGRYIKIYNNEFVNVGDSQINYGTSSPNTLFSDLYIFNNIFRMDQDMDAYPEYIRLYASASYGGGTASIAAINNIKVFNNIFLDNNKNAGCDASTPGTGYCPVQIVDFGSSANPTASGNEFRNNIFINMGNGSTGPAIKISPSSNFTASSFTFSNNIFYSVGQTYIKYGSGSAVSAAQWVTNQEGGTGKTSLPQFVSYLPRSASNDLRLKSTDTIARDSGTALSYFETDKEGVTRPQGSGWDIGPYEFAAQGNGSPSAPTNLRIN